MKKNELLMALIREFRTLRWQFLNWWEKRFSRSSLQDKTLWDWLQLLIVPTVLAIGAIWFDQTQQARTEGVEATRISEQRNIEATRIVEQQNIENDNTREQNLQAYFDDMTELMLQQNLRNAMEGSEARVIARAKTLATLRTLDSKRKGLMVLFLYEAKLIQNGASIIDLSQADLSGIDLSEATLLGAHLSGANLVGADLREANLAGIDLSKANLFSARLGKTYLHEADLSGAKLVLANLINANLSEADLSFADLSEAILQFAELGGANLSGGNLIGANLSATNLRGANIAFANMTWANLNMADLSNANLNGTKITYEQLALAKSLAGAIMPDGKVFDPEIHALPTQAATPIQGP